jgi:hypothetical protein
MIPLLPLEQIIANTKKNLERLEKANERIKVWTEKFEGWRIDVQIKGKMQARPSIEVELVRNGKILHLSYQSAKNTFKLLAFKFNNDKDTLRYYSNKQYEVLRKPTVDNLMDDELIGIYLNFLDNDYSIECDYKLLLSYQSKKRLEKDFV